MKRFPDKHRLAGWIVFAIAFAIYIMTLEPSASLWDSGEFIAAASYLQIPHPPGAPFYLLAGRLFSLFAGSDNTKIAFWINMLSALSSGLTIMFLYWTIVMIGKKIISGMDMPGKNKTVLLLLTGLTGSLSFAFTDSFWFSAVESEVYAFSLLFTSIVFWAMLRWEKSADNPDSDKWLIFIFFLIGISIGVHLLNLLTIPALVLVFYFRKFRLSPGGIALSILTGFGLIFLVMEGFIIGLPTVAGKLEIFLINSFHLPFGTGIFLFALFLISAIVFGVLRSHRKNKRILNTSLLCISFLLIGYASYGIILIRSNKDPLMDQNNPENILSFIYYLKRDQYLHPPLLYGPSFTADLIAQEKGKPGYRKGKEDYEITSYSIKNIYDPGEMMLLPRMWHHDDSDAYRAITGIKPGHSPDFGDNLYFLFAHQIGHMYVRYLLWNFAGRESDETGAGWLTPLDHFTSVPGFIRNNPGHNNYFMIPLILGLAGFFFTFRKARDSWLVLLILFLMTGVAIVIYLNALPVEPRERDYAYVGSFYAFSVWIGLGIPGLYAGFRKLAGKYDALPIVMAALTGMASPLLLITEGWNDHDRSGRYYAVDMARNMLASCPENAILFTGGDNDTFPLWYVQMVEKYRTDVRVIVTSYFNSEWYAEQMTRQSMLSDPLPFKIPLSQLGEGGPNDFLPYVQHTNIHNPVNLTDYLDLVRTGHPAILKNGTFGSFNTVPSREFYLDIGDGGYDSVPEHIRSSVARRIFLKMRGDYLLKSDLLMLDLIDSANWKRPICFSYTALKNANISFENIAIQRGMIYQLFPVDSGMDNNIRIDTATTYRLVMEHFRFRGLDDPKVYFNENYRQYLMNLRSHFNSLAFALMDEGKIEKAGKVLDMNLRTLPDESLAYDYSSLDTVGIYLAIDNNHKKALEISDIMGRRLDEELTWLTGKDNRKYMNTIRMDLAYLQQMTRILKNAGHPDRASRYEMYFRKNYAAIGAG